MPTPILASALRANIYKMLDRMGLGFSEAIHASVAEQATAETWTRDPFDRVIVAEARLLELPLVTKDGNLRRRYDLAVW